MQDGGAGMGHTRSCGGWAKAASAPGLGISPASSEGFCHPSWARERGRDVVGASLAVAASTLWGVGV